jgi:hypothetical protein
MALPTRKKKEKEIELIMGWFPFLLNHSESNMGDEEVIRGQFILGPG